MENVGQCNNSGDAINLEKLSEEVKTLLRCVAAWAKNYCNNLLCEISIMLEVAYVPFFNGIFLFFGT